MKKNLFHPSLKGIAFAIPLFLLLACCSAVFAQPVIVNSNCFTILNDTGTNICSTTSTCDIDPSPNGTDMHLCERCHTFRIVTDKCTGLNPSTFTVVSSSSTDCHSVCSPGDFNIDDLPSGFPGSTCSWYNPRIMRYVGSGGIPDLTTVRFTICHAANTSQTYTISLPPGTKCNGIDCTGATITFQ